MKTNHRSYADEAGDFTRLCRFVIQERDHMRSHSTWCLGRVVDWKYGLYDTKLAVAGFCDHNAHLWFDAFGDLAGLAISESGDAGFAAITGPGYRFLYTWADRGPRFSTEVTEHQGLEIQALERRGFRPVAPFFTRRFDLTRPLGPARPLETGFTIVDMRSHPDYRGQRILRMDAFEGNHTPAEAEISKQLQLTNYGHGGPIYHPETDLCVMAPDGRLVAGCEALIDARNREADIERVCTHSAFRKRGFARAAIRECMVRLRDMGMHSAYITGYSDEAISLYGSFGHADEKRCVTYECGGA
jgi:GNAT superfamily N-acetyltransferase